MEQLNKEELISLKTNVENCIELVKELSGKYDSKSHYYLLTQSVVSSVNSSINSITSSNEYLDGFYIMCDEINPIKLTDYLIKLKEYNVDKEILSYYVAHYLKRKINRFYKGLKHGELTMGTSMIKSQNDFNKFRNICYERISNGLKILRSK